MPKVKSIFACRECGAQFPKWLGQCSECGAWGSVAEEAPPSVKAMVAVAAKTPAAIGEVSTLEGKRISSGIDSLDLVLGGGFVPGSLTLLGGEPGIGKSTLLTQVSGLLASRGRRVLYLSGEESAAQVKLRAQRIGATGDSFYLANCSELSEAVAYSEGAAPDLLIVDSIQTMHSSDAESAPGSVSQVRQCATTLQQIAKSKEVAVVLVGHVTKDGSLAGPKVLEHLVDTVLSFEGEGFGRMRAVRAVKNRFGSVDEIAVFEMTERGLEDVPNPSAALLAERNPDAAGSAVFPAMEGSRAVLVEIQALVAPNYANNPRRSVVGLDYNRVMLVLGVLEKRCGLRLGAHDVFVSAVGGLQIREPAADLPVLLAVASSLKDVSIPPDLIAFGEIGLTGEIRSAGSAEQRLKEAARLGFTRAAVSRHLKQSHGVPGMKLGAFRTVQDALALLAP